ncbi:MAG: hypothetical protein RQ736_02535 [Thiogranum sp.]|nr:hypothetical protein [Thiogranum sp.]
MTMRLWQRLLITVVAMMAASFVASLLWGGIFNASIPGYLAGVIGGLAALPVWEWLRREKLRR